MDGRRFDEWTAALAGRPGSWRALARLLAGGPLGGAVAGLDGAWAIDEAAARRVAPGG